MSFKSALMSLGKTMQTNAPAIFTGLAVAGVIGSVVLTVKATQKVLINIDNERIFREEEAERIRLKKEEKFGIISKVEPEELTVKDYISLTWVDFIPPVISVAATVSCIIAAQHINARRQAALISALDLAQNTFKTYREKVVEQIGKNKEAQIEHEVHEEQVKKALISDQNKSFTSSVIEGDLLFFDPKTGQIFRSTYDRVIRASQEVNSKLRNGNEAMEIPLSSWLYDIGARDTDNTALYNQIFIPTGFYEDAIDINNLFDPVEEEYCGVKTIIVHLNYQVYDRLMM